jgi:quinol monooxygenase YgiN
MATKAEERHLVVQFRCAPHNAEPVKALLQEFVGPARKEDGCLYYDLYQNAEDPARFFILDGWRIKPALIDTASIQMLRVC